MRTDIINGRREAVCLASERIALRSWLFDDVLPVWWDHGANHGRAGGFHDRLGIGFRPEVRPLRLRVQARQVFVYAEAGRLGWTGPWQTAVEHGLKALVGVFRRDDGFYRAAVDVEGRVAADFIDLYDQAFVLLALAAAWAALGRPTALRSAAHDLLAGLNQAYSHPLGGYEEARPANSPLRSNPHMHLLEAMLAWLAWDDDGPFLDAAINIVMLARDHLIDRRTGAIGEFYDRHWQQLPGPLGDHREPGHQFEWAFLLRQAEALGVDLTIQTERLNAFGNAYGIRDGRVIAVVDAKGALIDGSSRLWQQTERLRASLAFEPEGEREVSALQTISTLRRFIRSDEAGLWYDRLDAEGCPIIEGAPASTLYHLLTGLIPLIG